MPQVVSQPISTTRKIWATALIGMITIAGSLITPGMSLEIHKN